LRAIGRSGVNSLDTDVVPNKIVRLIPAVIPFSPPQTNHAGLQPCRRKVMGDASKTQKHFGKEMESKSVGDRKSMAVNGR